MAIALFTVVEYHVLQLARNTEKLTLAVNRLAELVERMQAPYEEGQVSTTTTWTSGGQRKEWTTTKQSSETFDEFMARHKAEVAAQMQQFPPD